MKTLAEQALRGYAGSHTDFSLHTQPLATYTNGAWSWLIECYLHGFMGQWHELGLGSTPMGREAELVCKACIRQRIEGRTWTTKSACMNSWWDKSILLKRKRKRLSSLRGSRKKMTEENKGSKSRQKNDKQTGTSLVVQWLRLCLPM